MEFYEVNSPDVEGEFLEQIKKPTTFFKYQANSKGNKEKLKGTEFNEKMSFNYVKIPIVNPLTESLFSHFSLRAYFYFKSYKSQEYWNKRGTKIYINKV